MFGGIWQFVKEPDNQAVLASIGAGVAAIATGAWAVFTFLAKKREKGPTPPGVKAAPFDTEQQWRFLLDRTRELYKQGDESGDNAALAEAIEVYRRCLALAPRSENPLDWARTQMNLGTALVRLGERESGTARLEEAVEVYREALKENTRARVPLDWAMTQENLALAYRALYDKSAEPRYLDNALAAIAAALDGYRKAKAPFYIENAKRLQSEIFAARRK
ncbi:MAG: hypothetical protein ACT4O2_07170 [Beijerinckiaceae bacterium]